MEKLGFKYYKDTENTDYNGNICKQIALFLNNDNKVWYTFYINLEILYNKIYLRIYYNYQ